MPKQTITTEIDVPEGYEFVRIGCANPEDVVVNDKGSPYVTFNDGITIRPIFRKLEPPKPVRREWWCYLTPNGNMAGYMNDRQDQTCNIHVREVLPTDPSPEVIEEVANALNVAGCQTNFNGNAFIKGESLKQLAAKLRGETDA